MKPSGHKNCPHKRGGKDSAFGGQPLYDGHVFFSRDLTGIHTHKAESRLLLNRSVYTGRTILENSKIPMYDFHYNVIKNKYRPRCELIYTNSDSLLLEVKTQDFYKENIEMNDTSDYP